MKELLSIRLFALRSARLFPNIRIYFKSNEGVFEKFSMPRRLLLLKREHRLDLVFTKHRLEDVHDVLNCKVLDEKNLLFESYQAGEHAVHSFSELFQFLVKEEVQEHYLKRLVRDCDRADENNNEGITPISIFGGDLTELVNRCCCNNIGKRFENSLDLLRGDEEEYWGRDFVDMVCDLCLIAPSQEVQLKDRLLREMIDKFGSDLVEFVRERSQEIYARVEHRFNPNLLLWALFSDDAPSPRIFDY